MQTLNRSFWLKLNAKKIAVFGNGVAGKGLQKLLKSLNFTFEVFDQSEELFTLEKAKNFSLVVHSPGFAPYHPWLKLAYRSQIPCLNELDFASIFWPGKIIAVTGTNGKTSTTEWLACLFNLLGQKAFATGNNGYAFSELVEQNANENNIAVCEISSYQACTLRYLQPWKLLWTNFRPDHLRFHRSLKPYFKAKYRLVEKTQTHPTSTKTNIYLGSSAAKAFEQFGFPIKPQYKILPSYTEVFSYPSEHLLFSIAQQENFQLLKLFWETEKYDLQILEKSLSIFTPPPHRLKIFATINKARFWNDSKGTNLDSLEKALKSFGQRPIIWIGGGQSKGEALEDYATLLQNYPNIRAILLIGETGKSLEGILKARLTINDIQYLETLSHTIEICERYLNDTVEILLCPGFASWDQFKNYAERGQLFENTVLRLKNKTESLERKS